MAYAQQPPLPPEIKEVIQTPETIERKLIVGCWQSFRFYRRLRDMICPVLDPKTGTLRPDFSKPSFNKLYRLINMMYRLLDGSTPPNDFGIHAGAFENYLVDRVTRGFVTKDEALALLKEITEEAAQMVIPEAELQAIPNSPMFRAWLESRVVANEIKMLGNAQMLRVPTRADLLMAVARAEQSLNVGRTNAVNAGNVLLGRTNYMRPIPCDISGVNKALGGGFRMRDTTAVCAPTGGGKTVIAMQFAKYFAATQNLNTVVVTTEQPPEQLILRAVSSHLGYSFSEFMDRKDIPADLPVNQSVDLASIPPFLWTDPMYGAKMLQFHQILTNRLFFIDWSQGQGNTIAGNLDSAINGIAQTGWEPQVVIVDWVGGGLAPQTDRKELRHIYKDAAEAVIAHGKKYNRCMFFMCQADKVLAKESTKEVTQKMVSECKSMIDNAANFLGVSAMREQSTLEGTKTRLMTRQFINADKSRHGPGGLVPVKQMFNVQRFENYTPGVTGGDQPRP
jgi:hypothetical protein